MDRETILQVDENVDAVLVALYARGPLDEGSLLPAVPHPELIGETLRVMEEMGMIYGKEG